jgi:DNA-binding GntR family transcriptional regulator
MSTKYQRVINNLQSIINDTNPNFMIPSERKLSEQLQISRMTVRKAIDTLVEEGKLYRVNNVGTFVSDAKLHKITNQFIGFTSEVEAVGGIASNKIIDFKYYPAPKDIAQKLSIADGDMVYKVARVRYKNTKPIMIDVAYYPAELIPLNRHIIQQSIYKHIQNELGLNISSANHEILAVHIPQQYLGYLDVAENEPTIFLKTLAYLDNGTVFEYSESYKDQKEYDLIIQSVL